MAFQDLVELRRLLGPTLKLVAGKLDVAAELLNGIAGPQGPTGPRGFTGAAGADSTVPGPQGEPGADSTVPGPAGADGVDGSDGAPGIQGPAGADGIDGQDGLTVVGPKGPAGIGTQGPPGIDGVDGVDGLTIVGPQGPIGLTGAPGATGSTGSAGSTGATGATGSTGTQGPPGDLFAPEDAVAEAPMVSLANTLTRTANDFTSFAHKSTTAATDILLIEDSAAAGVKKYATIDEVVRVSAASQSPYTVRSSAPSVYDQEFNTAVADFGTLGFTVWNVTDNVNMTRNGSCVPWSATTGMTTTKYNSDIQGTYVICQFPAGKRVLVYKAFTPAAAGHLFGRAELTAGNAVTNNYVAVRMWIDNSGRPNTGAGTTLSVFAMIQNEFPSSVNTMTERFGRGDTTDQSGASGDKLTSRDGRGVYYESTNQYRFFTTGVGGIHQAVMDTAFVTGPTIASLAWIGFDFNASDSFSPTRTLNNMFTLDYLRHYSGTGWIL